MANETVMRKPDEQRKDPLAELARIIGDDNLYADLLRQRSRGHDAPTTAIQVERRTDDVPPALNANEGDGLPMPFRALEEEAAAPTAAERAGLNWDELEQDLARFADSARHETETEAAPPPVKRSGEDPSEILARAAAALMADASAQSGEKSETRPPPVPYEAVVLPVPEVVHVDLVRPVPPPPVERPEQADPEEDWTLRGFAEQVPAPYRAEDAAVTPAFYDQAAFDAVEEDIGEVRALAEALPSHAPAEPETPAPAQESSAAAFADFERRFAQYGVDAEADPYDFERRAADILEAERGMPAPEEGYALSAAGAAAFPPGADHAPWRPHDEDVEPPFVPPLAADPALLRAVKDEVEPVYDGEGHLPPHQPYVFPEDERRRRGGLATIGVIVGLSVAGAIGVMGYRAFVGNTAGPPKYVKAEQGPLKLPAAQESSNVAAKAIVDRMDTGRDKVLPREEQPLSAAEQLNQLKPPAQPSGPRVIPLSPPSEESAASASSPAVGSAVAPSEPAPASTTAASGPDLQVRSVKTVPVAGLNAPQATPMVNEPPRDEEPLAPGNAPLEAVLPSPRPADANDARKVRTLAVQPDGTIGARPPGAPARNGLRNDPNAPLSLSPQDQPARQAALAPPPRAVTTNAAGGYVVQITSVKSEAEAQQAFSRLQGRYGVLSGYGPNIRAVDLGARGVYHRVRVGPMSRDNADTVCGQIKAGGGDCIVQSN